MSGELSLSLILPAVALTAEHNPKKLPTTEMKCVLTWWVMSGLASAMSLPVFARMPWWSSQLRSAYFASLPPLPSRPPLPALNLYTSRHALSRTTINRRAFSFWAGVLGVVAGTGIRVGFLGKLLVGLDEDEAASMGSSSSGKPEGTPEGAGGGVPFLGEGARGWPETEATRLVGTNG